MRFLAIPPSPLAGITFRNLQHSDAQDWFTYLSRPEVFEHTSWDLSSVADLTPLLDCYTSDMPGSACRLAIVDEAHGALIGTVGFHTISLLNRTAEIAYDLAPEYWGSGIATRVCDALTTWFLTHEGYVRVQATALVTNQASMRVLEKCHFRREGLLRAYRMVRGTPGDFVLYSRLAADY